MKKTIKKTAIVLAFLSFSVLAKAQNAPVKYSDGIIYTLGLEAGPSTGNFKTDHKWTLGGSLQADIPLTANFYLNGNAGYTNVRGRNGAADIHLLPVTAGIKLFSISLLYLQANAGAGILLNRSDVGFRNTTAFIYAPQIGFQVPVGGNSSLIDIGFRYQGSARYAEDRTDSRINYFSWRLAYGLASK